MPTSEQHSRFLDEEKRPLFRQELRSVRRMVIKYSLDYPGDFTAMKSTVKIVAAIDELDQALAELAGYVRREPLTVLERLAERDREIETHHARYGF